jgi:hypothetical protein
MIIPEVVHVGIRTEDQVEDVNSVIQKIDETQEKMWLQSKTLQFDMQAFRNANSTAEFEDFVAWFSPSDFDRESRELSQRMATKGNIWRELWDQLIAGKTLDEQGLFDPNEQIEIAMDYFKGLTVTELLGDLIPVVLAAAYFRIKENVRPEINATEKAIAEIENAFEFFHREVELATENLPIQTYREVSLKVAKQIEKSALLIDEVETLMRKFPGCVRAVNCLMNNGGFVVEGEVEREAVVRLLGGVEFQERIIGREFLLTGRTETSPQQLFVRQLEDQIVVASVVRNPLPL